jgi:hypothetical protein
MRKVYTAEVVEDSDELLLQFPLELLTDLGWKEGDTLIWEPSENGSFTIKKKE